MAELYDFWIDNGLALVGSPDTVIRRLQGQQALVGYDVFVGQHHVSGMPARKSRSRCVSSPMK